MKIIGILADFINDEQKTLIKETAARGGYTVDFYMDEADATQKIKDAEVLYGYWPAQMLKQAENLRWLHSASAGVNTYLDDSVYAHPGQVMLTNSNVYGTTISEYMVMMTLMLMRREPEYMRLMADREWKNVGAIRSIFRSTFAIVGCGNIGTNFARRVKALGAAKVIGIRRTQAPSDPAFDQVVTFDQLPNVVTNVDVLALCVPETPLTKGLISRQVIDSLSPKTYIINVGRGSAIDQAALIDALNQGRIAGAALDVMTPEPLPKDDPLYDAKNIILTPHISGNMSLDYTCQLDVDLFVQNLKLYVEGKPLPHLIDRKIGY